MAFIRAETRKGTAEPTPATREPSFRGSSLRVSSVLHKRTSLGLSDAASAKGDDIGRFTVVPISGSIICTNAVG